MKDLIERQAAINALCKTCFFGPVPCSAPCDGIKEIRKLPFARPEQRWVPCNERLPDNVSEVLVSCKGKIKLVFFYEGSDGLHVWDDYEECLNEEPDAWMPLPEPYREEGE